MWSTEVIISCLNEKMAVTVNIREDSCSQVNIFEVFCVVFTIWFQKDNLFHPRKVAVRVNVLAGCLLHEQERPALCFCLQLPRACLSQGWEGHGHFHQLLWGNPKAFSDFAFLSFQPFPKLMTIGGVGTWADTYWSASSFLFTTMDQVSVSSAADSAPIYHSFEEDLEIPELLHLGQ